MKYFRRTSKHKMTFAQRLAHSALYWGIPIIFLEVVGIPRRLWLTVLVIAIPATIVGVLIEALIEQGIVNYMDRKDPATYEPLANAKPGDMKPGDRNVS
jgi:undecaprenyl pyrophosphate phosphatase UppP